MARRYLLITLIAIIAVSLSACFTPIPNPSQDKAPVVTMSASPSSPKVGDTVTASLSFTDELPDTVVSSVRIQGQTTPVTLPAQVTNLDFLRNTGAKLNISADGTGTLSFTVPDGRSNVFGQPAYTTSTNGNLYLSRGGTKATLEQGTPAEVGKTAYTLIGSKVSNAAYGDLLNATFSIQQVGSSEKSFETVKVGETKTISLGSYTATATITNVEMGSDGLVNLTLHVVPQGLAAGLAPAQDLVFTSGSGKRIDLGISGKYDTYLVDEAYKLDSGDVTSVTMTSGGETTSVAPGVPASLNGHTIMPTDFFIVNGHAAATVYVDPRVFTIPQAGGQVSVRDQGTNSNVHATGSYQGSSGSGYKVTVTSQVADTDQVFDTYAVEQDQTGQTIVRDRVSVQQLGQSATSGSYKFLIPGTYHVLGTATDERGHVGNQTLEISVSS